MKSEDTLKILVAEDDSFNQQLIQYTLEHMGAEVHLVADGIDALNMMLINKYHLILMDLNMPVMDGFEATANIRKVIEKSEQPLIIAFSADDEERDAAKCLESGFDYFLPKSLVDDLPNLIKALLPEFYTSPERAETHLKATRLLSDIADNDKQFFKKLLSDFLINGKLDMSKLSQSMADKNQEQFAALVHKIKGTYLFMGAQQLVEILRVIEKLSMVNDLVKLEELVYELRSLFEQLILEINQIILDIE